MLSLLDVPGPGNGPEKASPRWKSHISDTHCGGTHASFRLARAATRGEPVLRSVQDRSACK